MHIGHCHYIVFFPIKSELRPYTFESDPFLTQEQVTRLSAGVTQACQVLLELICHHLFTHLYQKGVLSSKTFRILGNIYTLHLPHDEKYGLEEYTRYSLWEKFRRKLTIITRVP